MSRTAVRCHRVTAVDIDHVTLRTSDLEGTRRFLENLLGLEVGYRSNFGFPGYWLYRSGRPIVHLIRGGGRGVARDAEMIDHVGFKVEGYEAFREKLDRQVIPHSTMDLPELGEGRLFIRAPAGILVELVFRSEPPVVRCAE